MITSLRGHKQRTWINLFIHFLCMFVHFFCLCPLRLVIMLNFNIPKVAYCIPTAKTTSPQWLFYKWAKYKINIFTVHYLPSLVNISIESLVCIVLLYTGKNTKLPHVYFACKIENPHSFSFHTWFLDGN